MINRPPTRIELKLEDDLADYEETFEMRKRNLQFNNNLNSIYQPNSPEDIYQSNQKNNLFSATSSAQPCRNFNLEFSSGALVSPNPHNMNRNMNVTKQNIISEFISEEGNEDPEEELQGRNFNFESSRTPHTPSSNYGKDRNDRNIQNIHTPLIFP